jgi:hypothetical protein
MFFFHGTRADAIEGIFARGLVPPAPADHNDDWARRLSGHSHGALVYLSTSPVAGKGGDPVSFALGWPGRKWRRPRKLPGYVVVIDLPAEALHLIHAVVPNIELDLFIQLHQTRGFFQQKVVFTPARQPLSLSNWCAFFWLGQYLAEAGVPLEPGPVNELLQLKVTYRSSDLPENLTPQRWRAFLTDYLRLMEYHAADLKSEQELQRQQQRLFRRYQLTLPSDTLEDSHSARCRLCLEALFAWSYRVEGFESYPPLRAFLNEKSRRFKQHPLAEHEAPIPYLLPDTSANGRVVDHLAALLRVVAAHIAPFPEADLRRFWLERDPTWTWPQWYRAFPAERCALPNLWRPSYGREFSERSLKKPDRQALAGPIPRDYILGAIRLSDGEKLLPHLRPNRRQGDTLSTHLWHLAHELRARYQGKPLLV